MERFFRKLYKFLYAKILQNILFILEMDVVLSTNQLTNQMLTNYSECTPSTQRDLVHN
jgi:hypothetical protein